MWEIAGCLLQKLALTVLPGAIYISGGVSNYLSDFFVKNQEIFWKAFLAHNQMREVLAKVEVFVLSSNPTLDALQCMLLNDIIP